MMKLENQLNFSLNKVEYSEDDVLRLKPTFIQPKIKTSEYKGVYIKNNKWIAQIGYNKKKIYIGSFEDEISAYNAYVSFKNKLIINKQ